MVISSRLMSQWELPYSLPAPRRRPINIFRLNEKGEHKAFSGIHALPRGLVFHSWGICLLKLTLNLPPQPSEHLFVLSGEEGERRGRSLWGFVLFAFLLKSQPPVAEGIWWEVQEAKEWGPLLGFSASRSPSHISFQVGLAQ